MADRSSPVDEAVVRHVASLARLDVPESDLPRLTGQLARIVSYIDQLKEIPEGSRVLTFCYDTGERYLSIEGLF